MSYAQNNYSWYPSKNNVSPGPPGAVPHLYNTPHHAAAQQSLNNPQPQWNSGVHQPQTQPYWQANPQQQQQQHNQQHHQQIQNQNIAPPDNQWDANPTDSDPWNWGIDDNSTPSDNKHAETRPVEETQPSGHVDAAWDWSVQGSESFNPPTTTLDAPTTTQYPTSDNYYNQNPVSQPPATPAYQPPVNNNALPSANVEYTSGYFSPPHQPLKQSNVLSNYHNSPAAHENAFKTDSLDYTMTNSGNYFVQQPTDQLSAPGLVNFHNSITRNSDTSNGGFSEPTSNFYVQQPSKQFDPISQPSYTPVDNSFQNFNPNATSVVGYDSDSQHRESDSSSQDVNYRPGVPALAVPNDTIRESNDNNFHNNQSVPRGNRLTQQHSMDEGTDSLVTHLDALDTLSLTGNDISEESRDNVSDISGSSAHAPQPRFTDYIAMQNNPDFEYLNPTGSTTGNKGLAAQWSTESLHSQGSDDVSPSREGESTPVEKTYQYDRFNNYPDSAVDKDVTLLAEEHVMKQHGGVMSAETLNVVCDQLVGLQVTNVNREVRTVIVENKETISHVQSGYASKEVMPPPTMQAPPPSMQAPAHSMQAPPPSMQAPPPTNPTPPPPKATPPPSMQMPPPGPPRAVGSVGDNPYSVSRNPSQSRYRVPNFAGAGGSDKMNYNLFVQPPQLSEPAANMEPAFEADNRSREDSANLETLPDNIEQPDALDAIHKQQMAGIQSAGAIVDRKSVSPVGSLSRINPPSVGQDSLPRQWVHDAPYNLSPENQEVTPGRCGPDRNQYLETGQLSEDDPNTWPGMQRMGPTGEGAATDDARQQNEATPPPGLHRMVPGQVTEHDGNRVSQFTDDQSQDSNDDVLLQRMVPGQLAPEQPVGVSDIPPPPGLRRMIPGESSSPESQAAQAGSRVVTGDGREEEVSPYAQPQMVLSQGVTSSTPLTGPTPTQPTAGERSETIGSDSVETYPPPQTDNAQRDAASNRREPAKHDRDRHHRDNESTDEQDGRRRTKKDYRGREREESPGGVTRRYKSDSRKGERDRHGNRVGTEDRRSTKEHRTSDRRGRQEASDSDNYSSDQYGRYRRDKSTDSRRYKEERGGRQYEGREGYGRDSRNETSAYKSRRTGDRRGGSESEYNSDYDRRNYDRKGYNRGRDYDHHGKPRYRDDYDHRRRYPNNLDGSRYRGTDRPEHDRTRYDASFRDKNEHRPDSRGHQARMHPADQQAYFAGPKPIYTPEYYAYYQQLRMTDPAAYAEWYNTVYARQIYPQSVSYSEDRGSVHSGRSSDNNNMYRERDGHPATNEPPASSTPQRLTPTFFSTAHVRGNLTNRGQMIKVLPNYPLDGQPATVEIHDMQGLCIANTLKEELIDFPGPLIKGSTHKNSVIGFCSRKIQAMESDPSIVDRDSAILLWQLLILLIKQNGNVVGTDISELLLTTRPVAPSTKPRSSVSSRSSHQGSHHGSQQGLDEAATETNHPAKFNVRSEEEVTTVFRDYLLYGNVKEALEWAMRNGLWGHALFLASKTDARQHANVMMRFANGLPFNDPLQTLYQIKSGRQPAAVTGCMDEKWGSWKPHLAMILANPSSPEVGHKAILTLGDTLAARGCLYAAHFTYLMAQTEFSPYSQRHAAKLVLIGSSHHHNKSFNDFATSEAIQMTEVYEYASRLADHDNAIPSFQWFKYVYAQRLMEQNMVSEALLYAEEISKVLLMHPDQYDAGLFKQVYELGDQLKYRDPLYTNSLDDTAELPWLVQLQQTLHNYNMGIYPQQTYPSHEPSLNHSYSEADHLPQPPTQPPIVPQEQEPPAAAYDPMVASDGYETALSDEGTRYSQYTEQPSHEQSYQQQWQQTPQWQQPVDQQETTQVYESTPLSGNASQSSYQNHWTDNNPADEQQPAPQISLPNSVSERKEKPTEVADKSSPAKTKPTSPQARGKAAGNGWFGGIWNKLSLKPKNQMILPEDKNPTIVWDPDRKRWVNMDADGEEVSTELAPPPKASDMSGAFSTPAPAPHTASYPSENGNVPNMQPPAPAMANGSAVNKYKLNNKGKSFRSNYVDVFGSSKMAPQSAPPPGLFPLMAGGNQHIFTPGPSIETREEESTNPTNDGSYDTPLRQQSDVQATHEVYAPNVSDVRSAYTGPMMYDPRTYNQQNAAASSANQYAAH